MARTNNEGLLLQGNMEHKTRRAIVWMRGYDHDPGTMEASVDALAKYECRQTMLKNELYYEGYVDPVDVCFTDDPGITADYENAGIKVVQLRPLTEEEVEARKPKNIIPNQSLDAENEALKKQIAMLTSLQMAQSGGLPANETVEQEKEKKAPEDQTNETLSLGSKSGAGKAAKNN